MQIIETTKKFDKAFKKLALKDPKLVAEIDAKVKLLSEECNEGLTIRSIIRKHKKNKIQEIKIKFPSEARVFYVQLSIE